MGNRRLSARVARLLLAREMWVRRCVTWDYTGSDDDDYSAWDDDRLLTSTYEKYIALADQAIREAMEREEKAEANRDG